MQHCVEWIKVCLCKMLSLGLFETLIDCHFDTVVLYNNHNLSSVLEYPAEMDPSIYLFTLKSVIIGFFCAQKTFEPS